MRNFEDTFETRKRSLFSAFSICMTAFKKKRFKEPSSPQESSCFNLEKIDISKSEGDVALICIFVEIKYISHVLH